MTAIDELRKLLDERGVDYQYPHNYGGMVKWSDGVLTYHAANAFPCNDPTSTRLVMHVTYPTPEQAIATTLGRPKAKAHPYGYEPDTGAFDVTRCECGCLNDISATYCNDCGGEIEIDMNAEKEIYHRSRHLVSAEKHDDGSLEFCGKRYIAKGGA